MGILDLFKLDGKTALVTGASRGLGQGMAVALAEAGANVVAMSRPGESHADTEKAVLAAGRSFKAYECDLGDRKALYAFIEDVRQTLPPIDILVNNAGTIMRKPAAEHPDDYWDTVINVNLTAQFILAREFGKGMVERGSGKVIFTASLLSFQGGITVPGYTASKSGVARLIRAFANEWSSKGVQVNGIAPGYMATDNTTALRADAARNKAILERIPAGRWGLPADLQGTAVFLASRASDYVSGCIIVVDGGWMGR
jgi:2-dehydro-3-deoxy-D-gluconate 5-dehydrogenase